MHIFTYVMMSLAVCFGFLSTASAQHMAKMKSLNHPMHAEAEWKSLGQGTMVDGWVTPGLSASIGEELNPSDYAFKVEVYESVTTPHLYKLKSPWTSSEFPFLSKNENTEPHDIVIDATNPDFVRVAAQESGFVNVDKDRANFSDHFYIGNAGSYFSDEEGYSESEIISYGYASTMKDGVITIVSPRFGAQPKGATYGYNWQGEYAAVITLPSGQPAEQWVSAGTATITDGFITPGYLGDPSAHEWTVQVEESTATKGLYRLVNPYTTKECPLAGRNKNADNAYIKIDASDPDIVVIEPQYAGFTAYHSGELINFYVGNDMGIYVADGVSKDVLKGTASLADKIDKLVDGVINIKNPLFGKNATSEFGYEWTDGQGEPMGYAARIELGKATAISGVVDGGTHAPAEYYDLQGMRVTTPRKGNVYIKRYNNKVSKILVK